MNKTIYLPRIRTCALDLVRQQRTTTEPSRTPGVTEKSCSATGAGTAVVLPLCPMTGVVGTDDDVPLCPNTSAGIAGTDVELVLCPVSGTDVTMSLCPLGGTDVELPLCPLAAFTL